MSSVTTSQTGKAASQASRASSQTAASAIRGLPLSPGTPVQFCTAVSRKPATMAATKPNSISCMCQASQPPTGCQLPARPSHAAIHKGMARVAKMAPARKKGRKPSSNSADRSGCCWLISYSMVHCMLTSCAPYHNMPSGVPRLRFGSIQPLR